jgi:hypothetical protein
MKLRKMKMFSAAIFYSPDTQNIELWSEEKEWLFDYCYREKMRGQVVTKKFTEMELHLMKLLCRQVYKFGNELILI